MNMQRSVVVVVCVFLVMAAATAVGVRRAARAGDPCGLPSGIALAPLGERDRSYALRHALACADYEQRRISLAEYRDRLRALDAPPPAPPPPAIVWASSVREVSSQYGATSWSASRVLGAPDAAAGADSANAWATLTAEADVEYIEVGYDQPWRARAVQIHESYNPGAVSHVELITADGQHRTVFQGTAAPTGTPSLRRRIDFACTAEPIVAVRVTLASAAVSGWNELDAIGLVPCE
jgi:hypothetical protein